jgi:DtxR family Mn-dependent transcriptional regulator
MPADLTESQEDYLEAIYQIATGEQGARSSEISLALGVKRPSVTTALKTLAEKGLVNYTPYDRISLTPQGQEIARNVVARHGIIRQFLTSVLGIPAEAAQVEACRLEHAFSEPVFARFVQFVSVLERCPDRALRWETASGFACGKHACRDCAPRRSALEGEGQGMEGFLKDLEVGDTAEIIGYRGESNDYRQKLLAMGITRGVHVTIIKVAPLGDPVEIEVRGFRLTVRRDEADALVVRRIGAGAHGKRRRHRGGHGGRHGSVV